MTKMTSTTETNSYLRLLTRAIRVTAHEGPAAACRRAIWKLQHKRFQRRRRHVDGRIPPFIQFLEHDFELHGSKQGVSEELFLFGVHEPIATDLYLQLLSPGDHVLDIGANLGYYLLLASDRVAGTGRLLGFEPAQGVYEVLERNVKRTNYDNIQVFPHAVGNKSGSLRFYESEIPNWGSLFPDESLRQTRTTTVEAKTIDEIVRSAPGFHPNALRMDIEGAELMVLEGAREVLKEYRPHLFIEFHNVAVGWDAVRSAIVGLRDLGYASGTLIERTWDQPWISKWMRERRCWKGSVDTLLDRVEDKADPLLHSTVIFVLNSPGRQGSTDASPRLTENGAV